LNAYIPFWDAVEGAVNNLAAFRNTVNAIDQLVNDFANQRRKYPSDLNEMSSNLQVPSTERTIERLQQVVRSVQSDSEFAKIFLMIRGNKIMIEGFDNLQSAIHQVGDRICDSIDRMSYVVEMKLDEISQSVKNVDSLTQEYREYLDQYSKMLDNIQYRRRPGTIGFRT